jgi:hypothetical protein
MLALTLRKLVRLMFGPLEIVYDAMEMRREANRCYRQFCIGE